MNVPSGVILVWTGTNASIPSGWERETTLDARHIKGTADAVNPNVTGGANTHTHTSTAHTHTLDSHTHTILLGTDTSTNSIDASDDRSGGMKQSHNHNVTTNAVAGGNLSDTVTYSSINHEPSYYEVIFIKPSGATAQCSTSVIGFYNGSSAPIGWSICDGTSGTPNLANKYLKGAATSGNAGGTGGGTSHTHDIGHTHISSSHYHTGTSGTGNEVSLGGGAGGETVENGHTHTVTTGSTSINGGAYVGTVTSGTVEPGYKKLAIIQNTAAYSNLKKGVIGMWISTLASIPNGWQVCDGTNGTPDMRGYYLKGAANFGECGTTGGSNTHVHAASNSHTHTATGTHTHSGNNSSAPTQAVSHQSNAGSYYLATSNHIHGLNVSSTATPTWASTTVTGDSSSNEPAYTTVAFVQKLKNDEGGAFLFNLI